MAPHEMLMTMSEALEKESRRHMEVANGCLKSDSIFISRMAATHVLQSLNSVVLALAQEAFNAERNSK